MSTKRQKRFEEHALQKIASGSNPNDLERRLAVELLEARDALIQIHDLGRSADGKTDLKNLAAQMDAIAQIAMLD
jgi:hypothetical protein